MEHPLVDGQGRPSGETEVDEQQCPDHRTHPARHGETMFNRSPYAHGAPPWSDRARKACFGMSSEGRPECAGLRLLSLLAVHGLSTTPRLRPILLLAKERARGASRARRCGGAEAPPFRNATFATGC